MRTVVDENGRHYLLLKRSDETWLVRDPHTGAETYRPASEFTVESKSPLETNATAIPEAVRLVIQASGNNMAIGLLVELADRGPTPVRTLIEAVELCESDLHGILGELQAAGAITATSVAGEPGYALTAPAEQGIDFLRTQRPPEQDAPTDDTS